MKAEVAWDRFVAATDDEGVADPEVRRPAVEAIPSDAALAEIERLNAELHARYAPLMRPDTALDRRLVSFQANKSRAVYRWYKYKEGFSAALVERLLAVTGDGGPILDPFAGSGTTLFAASRAGLHAEGIELLPIGQKVIATRQLVERGLSAAQVAALAKWQDPARWRGTKVAEPFPELRITRGAYPQQTQAEIGEFLTAISTEQRPVRDLLQFALLCVLEDVSFTRKDGQYLRWDSRASRSHGRKVFNKGAIPTFAAALVAKLQEIAADLSPAAEAKQLFGGGVEGKIARGGVTLHRGSCLDVLPQLAPETFAGIITSPPYCNRYDYTRTYALELAALGVTEAELLSLRQNMLTCTVENKLKGLRAMNPAWRGAIDAAAGQELLQAILQYLETQRAEGRLNNSGIPRMVRGYFDEMACVVYECARVLKPGAALIMVNDNVRYAGVSVSVDLILASIAQRLGLQVEQILVLPTGKGNSSQQMGHHGRDELRKCVYVWRKVWARADEKI